MENVEKEISSLGLGIRAKTLINLRWIAVLGQIITCLVVEYFFGFQIVFTLEKKIVLRFLNLPPHKTENHMLNISNIAKRDFFPR